MGNPTVCDGIKTVIMAGGKGTRIQEIDSSVPKPLISINGKPIIQYELECLISYGLCEIIITISHKADMIKDFLGDGSDFGCRIDYFTEEHPLGNAGALFKLWESGQLAKHTDFFLLNADTMFNVDFNRFLNFHRKHNGLATLLTHPNSHPYDSGLIIIDEKYSVERWLTKEDERPPFYKNRVNAGLHMLNTDIFSTIDIDISSIGSTTVDGQVVKVDLDRQVLKPLAGSGRLIAYDSPEYVKDMGTPERFHSVCSDLIRGKIKKRNLSNPQKAIFLDRDGTINYFMGFLRNSSDFKLLPQVDEAIRLINDSGYLCIVVTNQPVIARGEVTVEELSIIHNKMETLLGENGAYIDALYYCPHHPDKGFEGEVPALKFDCDCRKPKPGLIIKASRDFNIDLSSSWMIGDTWRDIECGVNAGTHTVLLNGEGTEINGSDEDAHNSCIMADLVAPNLFMAINKILSTK